ncbi:7-carboxy-7-deazaguanine synthase [Corallococcus aberystwythensis]|uniref:7-carboxy-7-deazaguanine synthase n=1 Tax=Corallococcus aberystwythensis TaxID=2316722 RepID=A0A3A8Q011_9BACT|nr:7-carboxy-7-deazaguanine synthase [Corallococcus aberystwythensis]RKH62087.1 7-carboxy-7-deazaguanine synthase [Corallococcus aberystwythensis]
MSYAVKELFYTLQGEGAQAGRAAVFLRFAGCNLWSGLERDRERGPGGCSRWCDTQFVGTNGAGGGRFTSAELLAEAVALTWPQEQSSAQRMVVCTGGEPLLQLDTPLVDAMHARGFLVAVETNGTRPVPQGIDWVCVSPKAGSELVQRTGNELKLVFPQAGFEPDRFEALGFTHFILQPMDGPDRVRNTQVALEYCLEHPQWRLGIQMHKVLGIP